MFRPISANGNAIHLLIKQQLIKLKKFAFTINFRNIFRRLLFGLLSSLILQDTKLKTRLRWNQPEHWWNESIRIVSKSRFKTSCKFTTTWIWGYRCRQQCLPNRLPMKCVWHELLCLLFLLLSNLTFHCVFHRKQTTTLTVPFWTPKQFSEMYTWWFCMTFVKHLVQIAAF